MIAAAAATTTARFSCMGCSRFETTGWAGDRRPSPPAERRGVRVESPAARAGRLYARAEPDSPGPPA